MSTDIRARESPFASVQEWDCWVVRYRNVQLHKIVPNCFRSVCTISHHQQYTEGSVGPHFLSYSVLQNFLIFTSPVVSMVSHLPLIYISLIIYEGEHPFICLLTICVSLIKLGTSVQDTTKNVRNQLQTKRSYLPHTQLTKNQCEEYIQEGNSLNRKWTKEMAGIHRKSSVISITYKDVFVFTIPAGHRAGFS